MQLVDCHNYSIEYKKSQHRYYLRVANIHLAFYNNGSISLLGIASLFDFCHAPNFERYCGRHSLHEY